MSSVIDMNRFDHTMDSAPDTAFDGGVYSTPARSEPFSIGQGYPLPAENSYDPMGWQSWNQYLNSIPVGETFGHVFDQSYSLSASADSTRAVGALDGVSGDPALSLGWGDDNYQPRADPGPLLAASSITADARSGYTAQQPDDHHQLDAYGHQQQQHRRQDVVPATVSPDALSRHTASGSRQRKHPGIATDQFEQQTGANPPKTKKPRSGSTAAATKRRDTVDNGDGQQTAPLATKRRQQTSKVPVLAPVDTWTPPTPRTLHESTSSSSLADSVTSATFSFSPGPYKRASAASLGTDDLDNSGSRREPAAGGGSPGALDTQYGWDNTDRADSLVSPAQTATGPTEFFQSLGTTASPFSAPTSSAHQMAGYSASHPNTRSSSLANKASSSSLTSTSTSLKPTSTTAASGRPRTKSNAAGPAAPPSAARGSGVGVGVGVGGGGGGGRRLSQPESKARNRLAATKCRLKTKATIERLEEQEAAGSERHRELTAAAADLRRQVYELHSMLLLHVDCGCEMIQAYLVARARALADGAAAEASARG